MRVAWLAALCLACCLVTPSVHAQEKACQYILGFETLHDLAPSAVGECLDSQAFAANGDAQQHTTHGLLAWRKAGTSTGPSKV